MILPDTNLLLYATNKQSPFYKEAWKWWTYLLNGEEPVGLCAPVLFAYIRISTSPWVAGSPQTVEQAFAFIHNWMGFPSTQWLATDDLHLERVKALLLEAGTGGNLVTDAQIAAYALQYDATVHTADADFGRFHQVRWQNPLLP